MQQGGMRVLVAEDSVSMRELVCKMLEKLGYTQIEAVEDGAQALERIHSISELWTNRPEREMSRVLAVTMWPGPCPCMVT